MFSLLLVIWMEDGFAAKVADVSVNTGAVLVVTALAHDVERAELRFGVCDGDLRHCVRVDHESPTFALLLLKFLCWSQFCNLSPGLGRFEAIGLIGRGKI